MQEADAEAFVNTLSTLLEEALVADRYLKIKKFGTFKLIDTEEGRNTLSFVPDKILSDAVNKPFSQFETVLLKDDVHFDDMPEPQEENEGSQAVPLETFHAAGGRSEEEQPRKTKEEQDNRTISLIDNFLDSIPKEEEDGKKEKKKRKPTPADAAVDYVAYLLESEEEDDTPDTQDAPQLKGQSLIDDFLKNDNGKIVLNETPQFVPEIEATANKDEDEGYFTETLARIYIKQGQYSKALEIIQRLSLNYPKKNAYFADQIRFLNKLIINNNKK